MRALAAAVSCCAACSLVLDPEDLQVAADSAVAPVDAGGPVGDAPADPGAPALDPGVDPGMDPGMDPGADVAPMTVVIGLPGIGGICDVNYDPPDIPGVGCPKTCPGSGWQLAFDGTGTAGATQFAWTFSKPPAGYKVSPSTSTAPKPVVTVMFDACLLDAETVDDFDLFVTLQVDDGSDKTTKVRLSPHGSDGCTDSAQCPAP